MLLASLFKPVNQGPSVFFPLQFGHLRPRNREHVRPCRLGKGLGPYASLESEHVGHDVDTASFRHRLSP